MATTPPPETLSAAAAPPRADDTEEDNDDGAAALPDLDHLTMRDFYDIYEVRVRSSTTPTHM